MTPDELNNAAATAIGLWNPNVMCPQDLGTKTGGMICARCGSAAPDWTEYDNDPRPDHPFPPPDMSLPTNVVKMIEWLAARFHRIHLSHGPEGWTVQRYLNEHQSMSRPILHAEQNEAIALQKAVAVCAELGGER